MVKGMLDIHAATVKSLSRVNHHLFLIFERFVTSSPLPWRPFPLVLVQVGGGED